MGVPREVGTQHQAVDEEADDVFEFRAIAVGAVSTDNNVVLAGVAEQQRLEGGQ